MDIRFEVGGVKYQLTSDSYQVILNKVGVSQGEKSAGKETFSLVGYYKDEFMALEKLVDKPVYECSSTTFEELAELRINTLNQIKEIANSFRLEKTEIKPAE